MKDHFRTRPCLRSTGKSDRKENTLAPVAWFWFDPAEAKEPRVMAIGDQKTSLLSDRHARSGQDIIKKPDYYYSLGSWHTMRISDHKWSNAWGYHRFSQLEGLVHGLELGGAALHSTTHLCELVFPAPTPSLLVGTLRHCSQHRFLCWWWPNECKAGRVI